MNVDPAEGGGPLSPAEAAMLDTHLLPARERHHLRLLAHSLRTLQAIAHGASGDPTDLSHLTTWLEQQQPLQDDPCFVVALAKQLQASVQQLEQVALPLGRPWPTLELTDLIAWAGQQADLRLATGPPTTPPKPPTQLPANH